MGGNASPFIADLYLSWCEFIYMQSLAKTDIDLARKFEFNSRYLDDIGVINYLGFSDIAKKIYHPTLVLEKSDHSSRWDTFLDLFIRIMDNKFIIGIYHKVDDFSFDVISFPFPESNVQSSLGHNCFYSQIIRFYGLCNNVRDFTIRVNLLYTKLIARGYEHNSFEKSFYKCCLTFNIHLKFGIADVKVFWNQILQFKGHVCCNVKDNLAVNSIVKPCSVILDDIYRKPKQKFAGKIKRCYVNLLNINESYTVSDNSTYHMSDNKTDCVAKHSYIPFGIENPRNHCYLNSILQVMFSIFHHIPLDNVNNNSEGKIIRYIHDISNSELSAANTLLLKHSLSKRYIIMDGRQQQDAHECFSIFLDILHDGTQYNLVDDGVSTDDITSIKKELFSSMASVEYDCSMCGTVSNHMPTHSIRLFNLQPTNSSISKLIQGSFTVSLSKKCNSCGTDTDHFERTSLLQPPQFVVILINRFRTDGGIGHKDQTPISIENNIYIKGFPFLLFAIIHHHGITIRSGHYTAELVSNGKLYTCDDNFVSSTSAMDSFESKTAYMVFYKLVS